MTVMEYGVLITNYEHTPYGVLVRAVPPISVAALPPSLSSFPIPHSSVPCRRVASSWLSHRLAKLILDCHLL